MPVDGYRTDKYANSIFYCHSKTSCRWRAGRLNIVHEGIERGQQVCTASEKDICSSGAKIFPHRITSFAINLDMLTWILSCTEML